MTDAPERNDVPDQSHPPTTVPPLPPRRPERLVRIAAWCAIVASAVVVVAVIFGAGFLVGTQVGDGLHTGKGHERGQMFEMNRPQPPMGPFERPRVDGQFPNFPGMPQPPEEGTSPARPSTTPTP